MTAGALVVLFWAVIALLGAMSGFAFILGLRGLPVLALVALTALLHPGDALAAGKFTKTTAGGFSYSTAGNKGHVFIPETGTGNLPMQVPSGTPPANMTGPAGTMGNTMTIPAGMATGHASGGWPDFKGKAKARVPGFGNKEVPIDVAARPAKGSLGTVLAKFAKKAGPWSNAIAVYELLEDLGVSGQWNPETGENTFSRTYSFDVRAMIANQCQGNPYSTGTLSQLMAICIGQLTDFGYSNPQCEPVASAPTSQFICTRPAGPNREGSSPVTVVTHFVSSGDETVPMSVEDLADLIAGQSGWPANSPFSRAVADAINSGEGVDIEGTPTVTGPASVPGPSTTTTQQGPNGTTTTTTNTTINITYNNNEMTVNTTTVTNVTHPDGSTETKTETQEPEEEGASDTPLPDVPKLYERKYPDGVVGVWNTRKAELSASPLMSLVGQLMPSIGPGGTCPQWPVSLNFGPVGEVLWDFGTHDVAPPCSIWPLCAAIIIVSALLLARALIFGG